MVDRVNVGKNIAKARSEKGYTQKQLGDSANLSTTQISAYENGKQLPGLVSLASIARALDTTIDRLYYGDESESFITSAASTGRAVANSVIKLYSERIFRKVEAIEREDRYESAYVIRLNKCGPQIQRLVNLVSDLEERVDTFSDPKEHLDGILSSAAAEIDKALERRGY